MCCGCRNIAVCDVIHRPHTDQLTTELTSQTHSVARDTAVLVRVRGCVGRGVREGSGRNATCLVKGKGRSLDVAPLTNYNPVLQLTITLYNLGSGS